MRKKIGIDIELLKKKYIDEKKGIRQVAKDFGMNYGATRKILGELGVRRSLREARWVDWHGEVINIDENQVRQMYVEEMMSSTEIAMSLSISGTTVWQILNKVGGVRSQREAGLVHYHGEIIEVDENAIKQMYLEQRMSSAEIAEHFSIGKVTVWQILNKMEIVRTQSDANRLRWEPRKLRLDDELIRELYLDERMTSYEVAERLGVSQGVIQDKVEQLGINRSKAEGQIERWNNPEKVKKILLARNIKPNKDEVRIDCIIQSVVPKEFAYNGGYELGFAIERKIPDWVNVKNKKQLIEYNGCYYHACEECGFGDEGVYGIHPQSIRNRDRERLSIFASYGFATLVLWQHDSDEIIANRVRQFVEKGGNQN